MIETEGFKIQLEDIREKIGEAGKSLDIEHLKEELIEHQEDMASPGFWDDMEKATRVSAQAHRVEAKIRHFNSLVSRADDIEVMMELAEDEDDHEMAAEIKIELEKMQEELDALRLTTLLTGEYDGLSCILSLHAGAGGTEAQDWTEMLYRMYTRYAERMGFAVKEVDFLEGDEAGIKSVTFEITGDYAYGYLKCERGRAPFGAHLSLRFQRAQAHVVCLSGRRARHRGRGCHRATPRGHPHRHLPRVRRGRAARQPHGLRRAHHASGDRHRSAVPERAQPGAEQGNVLPLVARAPRGTARKAAARADGRYQRRTQEIEWGSQIRSYVFQPYKLVKDLRTGYEVGDVDAVMDGKLEGFVTAYLQMV